MKKIINFTQHKATSEQKGQGVIDLPFEDQEAVQALLTFEELPTPQEVRDRVQQILLFMLQIEMEHEGETVDFMVGGAPWLMGALAAVENQHISGEILCAYSKRVSVEYVDECNLVQKRSVFKHEGFVPLNPQL